MLFGNARGSRSQVAIAGDMLRWWAESCCCLKAGGRIVVALGWLFVVGVRGVSAEAAVRRSFDGPETAWQVLNNSVPVQLRAQECIPGGARDKAGCERVVLVAPAGQSAMLVCPIAHMAVLD